MPENHGFEESQEIHELGLKNKKDLPPNTAEADAAHQDGKIYSFDEAITLAKVGSFHYFLQFTCGMCLMTATVEVMGMSIIMPFITHDIPSTSSEKGLLASAGFLGIVLSSHAVGFLSDTWGRARMLRTTLSISFLTSFASVFSYNIWMLIVFRFLTGFIMSGCQGSVFNYLGEFHSSKTRAKYVTMLSVFAQLGMIFMPAVALVILPLKLDITILGLQFQSWRLLLLVFSCMRTFALIGLFTLPESPKFVFVQGDHEKALETLRMIYSKNTKNPQYEYPVHQIAPDGRGDNLKNVCGVKDAVALIWTQTTPLFNKSRVLHTVNICLIMFLMSAVSHGSYMWFPTILKQQIANIGSGLTTCEIMHLVSNDSAVNMSQLEDVSSEVVIDTTMFKILITIGTVFSVTFFLFALIINTVGKRKFLFGLILIPGLSALVLHFITNIPWAIVILTIVMTLSNGVGIVGTMAFEFFPTNVSGMGMSLVMMMARVGSAAGSSIFGSMINNSCDKLFYISFASCMLLLVLSILLPGKR
ncbi:synaptic vesicle glycoprotein 2C-like [Eupeodes corollae]|uniref:synaptic vesicle glycoprotein 2C-like n=1 Tax=Eupeodes corollae TaxID=290404 RepID=UPI0024938298|nr:synaptic vesicle glycoprotein 2C-like [Eupeodes corollae]